MTDIQKEIQEMFGAHVNAYSDDRLEMTVRGWGSWHIDPEVEDQEEEDPDHEILTDESEAKLLRNLKDLREKFPNYKIQAQQGEKNYIDFYVKLKSI